MTELDVWKQVFDRLRAFGYSDEEVREMLGNKELMSKAAKRTAEMFEQYCRLVCEFKNKLH